MIDETVIDTRKKDKNVVIISEEWYGEMEKAERNSVRESTGSDGVLGKFFEADATRMLSCVSSSMTKKCLMQ